MFSLSEAPRACLYLFLDFFLNSSLHIIIIKSEPLLPGSNDTRLRDAAKRLLRDTPSIDNPNLPLSNSFRNNNLIIKSSKANSKSKHQTKSNIAAITMKSFAFSFFLWALVASSQLSAFAAQECLTVDTVQDLDLDAFISKPWYGTCPKDILRLVSLFRVSKTFVITFAHIFSPTTSRKYLYLPGL